MPVYLLPVAIGPRGRRRPCLAVAPALGLDAPMGPKIGPVIATIREAAREDGGLLPEHVGGIRVAVGYVGTFEISSDVTIAKEVKRKRCPGECFYPTWV